MGNAGDSCTIHECVCDIQLNKRIFYHSYEIKFGILINEYFFHLIRSNFTLFNDLHNVVTKS